MGPHLPLDSGADNSRASACIADPDQRLVHHRLSSGRSISPAPAVLPPDPAAMSVSVHPIMPAKAIESFDFRSRMDSSAAKFTAVNNPAPTKDPPKSFTFRPDPSATTIANGNSTVPGKPEEPSKQLHGSDNPEKSAWDLERPGSDAIRLHDDTNVTLAKRKRSLDGTHEHQEEEIRLPSRSAGSPMDAHMRTHEQARSALEHIEPERTIDSAGTGSERSVNTMESLIHLTDNV